MCQAKHNITVLLMLVNMYQGNFTFNFYSVQKCPNGSIINSQLGSW